MDKDNFNVTCVNVWAQYLKGTLLRFMAGWPPANNPAYFSALSMPGKFHHLFFFTGSNHQHNFIYSATSFERFNGINDDRLSINGQKHFVDPVSHASALSST